MDALPLTEHLGPIAQIIDEWLDRNPGGKVVVCEANRFRYKGNWKLAYDNSCDGYHVAYSHRSLLETENRFAGENAKGMAYYRNSPDTQPMYMRYTGHGNHFKDKRPNLEKRPGGLWTLESAHPGMEHYEAEFLRRYGDRAFALLDLAGSEPVNINVFPNFSLLGNHIQVFEPVGVAETNAIWYGTMIVDDGSIPSDAVADINALRMRTQEGFPNFGEVDDIANFEQIQRGLMAVEDEWVYMNRGFGIPGRVKTNDDGTITAPATDEAFMREHFKEWKRLMKARKTSPSRGSHDMNAPAGASDPSRSSHYVNDALYRELIANFTDWQDDARAVSDPAVRDEFRQLIEREARLLDQLRYEDWLKMYTAECIYWVPSTPQAGDPRREISVMFDDRRRLEDRIYRLRTGFAWSQAPASRTVRLITNVEVFAPRMTAMCACCARIF